MKRHERFEELAQDQWLKQQILDRLELREAMFSPDGKKAEYLTGVPAALLLAVLM